MNIVANYDIINFNSKIQKIYKTVEIGATDFDPIEPNGQYNATCTLFETKDETTCAIGYCSNTYEQVNEPKTIMYFDKNETGENDDFVELHLYASNGNYYIYYTKEIEYNNQTFFLLDINNLKVNEYGGDQEFYFFDYDRGITSNILNFYETYYNGLKYTYNSYLIDNKTNNKRYINGDIISYKENGLTLKNYKSPQNNYYLSIYDNTTLKGTYSNKQNNHTYNNFEFENTKKEEYKSPDLYSYNTGYEELVTNNFIYNTTKAYRNCIGQNEVIDFNYNNYIQFEAPYISFELILLPKETPIETNIDLKIFNPLENLSITATATLGAIILPPLCILFIIFCKKVAI